MKNSTSSTQYGQFLILYFTAIGLWMCSEAVAKVCWIGNEPDQSGRMKFVLREKDPCSCTKIRLGGVSMTATGPHHDHASMYFNGPVMTEDAEETAHLLNCRAVDAEQPPCVSFDTSGSLYKFKFAALPESADGGVRFEFSARAPSNVHISFFKQNEDTGGDMYGEMYEIVIGGWGDKKSAIRRGKQADNEVETAATQSGWLDKDTFKEFWVSAVPNTNTLIISVGKGSDMDAFLTFKDQQPIPVKYLGFALHGSIKGSFKFCGLAPK